jgi:acyl dehydratase
MIDYRQLRDWQIPDTEQSYSVDDSIRYALALGIGSDPSDERQLRFVNDTVAGQPLAFPTMAVVLGFPGSWMADPATGIDFPKIVHGEELLVMHRPLASAGTIVARHRIVRIVDKGVGRGATITYDKALFDKATGELLATVTHTTFARGDGGFSARDGVADQAMPPPTSVPTRKADTQLELATLPQQALMYRLCADRNPLHSEPAIARAAGFERPILHGLCTYGVAARAVLAECCDDDPRRLKSLFARFSAPVYPGETLLIDMFREEGAVLFQARARERDKVVLDCGLAEIQG